MADGLDESRELFRDGTLRWKKGTRILDFKMLLYQNLKC